MEQTEYKEMDIVEKNHFWFVAKRKFLQIIFKKYFPSKTLRVLDVGCGTGAVLEWVKNMGHIGEGVDNSLMALEYCREKGLKVELGTAESMNYQNETFDVVLALDVLEHLDDDKGAVLEIHRILKKGGCLIATVPAHKQLWSYHDVALHHKRRYTQAEFSDLLKEQFQIKLITWIHSCILIPTWFVRKIGNVFKNNAGGSDVKSIHPVINCLGGICYLPEFKIFKIFGKLPVGVSLLAVVEKK